MRTKIYEAFRFKQEHLTEFLEKMEEIVFERVGNWLTKMVATITEEYKEKKEPEPVSLMVAELRYGKYGDWDQPKIRQWVLDNPEKAALMYIMAEAIQNSKKGYRFANLDCGINLWPHGEYLYCITYMSDYIDQIKPEDIGEWCEEFAYWNNTDPPEGMREGKGYDAWQDRGRIWNEINGEDHHRLRLTAPYIEGKDYPWIGFDRLLKGTGFLDVDKGEHIFFPSIVNDVVRSLEETEIKKKRTKNPPQALKIPIAMGRSIALKYGYDQVLIWSWNKKKGQQHMTTFGRSVEDCDHVAQAGVHVKQQVFGWPESDALAEPHRVTTLKKRVKELEAKLND